MNDNELEAERIVFFDGVCNLCNRFINFLIQRDTKKRLKFAPLQGATAHERLPLSRVQVTTLAGPNFTSVVYLKNGVMHFSSDAAIEILKELDGLWNTVRLLKVVPRPLRDVIYRYVATNRYKWFGRTASCRIPTPSERARFLD